jgi:hypothetical protein
LHGNEEIVEFFSKDWKFSMFFEVIPIEFLRKKAKIINKLLSNEV